MKHALALAVVLGCIAAITPAPKSTDRGFYERLGRELIIRDCSDIHCFRPLVPGVLEHLPGPSHLKWKAYAVITNAVGALAVGRFCLLIGLSVSASIAATWLSALGTGSLYSLFDPYTADPLMYMLGPLLAIELWQGRAGRAGWIAAVGVFAKEFAAAPLWIFTGMSMLSRRWPAAARLFLLSAAVTLVWLSKQTGLMALQNYRFGFTASDDLLHGGYIVTWLSRVKLSGALMYLFTTFAALYALLPAGFSRARGDLRLLALVTLPAAAAFLYVEQPERALWNFHFVVIPIAVLALEGLPTWMITLFVAASGGVGLRYGAQLEIRWIARAALLVAMGVAIAATVAALRRRTRVHFHERAAPQPFVEHAAASGLWWIAALEAAVLGVLVVLSIDVHAHRLVETTTGINQWGYRGPLETTPQRGVRIAVVGGSAAFAADTPWWETMPARLAAALSDGGRFAWVDNLSEPGAGASSYVTTLRDYAYLRPDVVCIFDGYDAVDAQPPFGRRTSIAFRLTGYLPGALSNDDRDTDPFLQDNRADAGDPSCGGGSAAYCAAMGETVRFALQQGQAVVVATPPYVSARHEAQQRSLAERLDREFAANPRFRYVNLGRSASRTMQASQLATGIIAVIPRGNDEHRTTSDERTPM